MFDKDFLKYPRSTMRRDSFISLDGEWLFVFDDDNIGEERQYFNSFPTNSLTINVPFAYQCELSGINNHERHDVIW